MINVVIQALTLLCALLVNFVIPAFYGLELYGAFIQANILVFLFQKLADISTEPLIGCVDHAMIFPVSMLIAVCVWLVFWLLDGVAGLGSTALLAAMLLSSSAMLSMYALRQQRRLVAYLIFFLVVFFALLILKERFEWTLSIVDILFWTNLLPALLATLGLLYSGVRLPSRQVLGPLLSSVARMVPGNFSVTLVFNLFTNLLPYILSKTLPLRDLGLFRVAMAVIQSATTIFPINTKTIFVRLVGSDDRIAQFRILFVWSLIYFAGLGATALLAGYADSRGIPYLVLVASLPTLYWAVLIERYLQATKHRRELMVANLIVGSVALASAFLIETLGQAVLYYSLGLSVYTGWLLILSRRTVNLITSIPVIGLAPLVAQMQSTSLIYPLIYFVALLLLAWWVFKPGIVDLERLRGHP
ncbi:MAG: hypothetical protein ABS91_00785 [Thiobacillus sp. SCN 64-35]|nr:MAG: hypothetical protein ABS91_00785 [Thiobacillus sp. SCN 64-35]